jgi:hypothetical protein
MIDKNAIGNALDEMAASANTVAGKKMSNQIVDENAILGQEVSLPGKDDVFTDEAPDQVAILGAGKKLLNKKLKQAGKYIEESAGQKERGEIIEDALEGVDMQFEQVPKKVDGKEVVDDFGNTQYEYKKDDKGNLIPKDTTIVKPTQRSRNYQDAKKEKPEPRPELNDDPQPISTDPVDIKKAEEIAAERQKFLNDPEAKRKAFIQQGINESVYDNESFDATIAATSQVLSGDRKIQRTTLADLKKQAYERGIPEHIMERRLAGYKFDSTVGGNDLAIKTMALMDEYDKSAQYIDTLMMRAAEETLSEPDKFNLLQQLKLHQVIEKELMGVKQDVATSMNTFKRMTKSREALDVSDFTTFVDENMSPTALKRLANVYLKSPTRQIKNQILSKQDGGFKKMFDSAYYTFMSNILNDVKTWSENLVGSAIHGVLMTADDIVISGMNSARAKLGMKRMHDQELDDMIHSLMGFRAGLENSLASASYVFKTGERAGYKGEKRFNPLSAENFSNTSFTNPFSKQGKAFYKTGDLKDTWAGSLLDTAGLFQSISMRFLAGGDEVIGTTLSTMALRKEASKYVKRRLDELADEGVAAEIAKKRVSQEVAAWATELPADIHTSMKEVKDMIQFTYSWDKTKRLDSFYAGVNKFLSAPVVRYMVPFSNTLTKIFDQGASRIPILNFISPQFHKDWQRGGYYRDRAKARLLSGSAITFSSIYGAAEGKLTGGGPRNVELKKALENTGWQQYSFVREKSKYTDEQIKQLKKYTDVNVSGDKVYISYQRFDILAQVIGAGVDFHDVYKHYDGDPDSPEVIDFTLSTLGATSKFMENLPLNQFVGELTRINAGNFENEGDLYIKLFDQMIKSGMSNVALTVPFASAALQSSATAHVARLVDPDKPSKLPDEITYQGTVDFVRSYESAKKSMIAKVPFLRGDITKNYDELGRPMYNKNTILEDYMNVVPFISRTKERRSRVDEQLVEYNINLSKASPRLERQTNVVMTADHMATYKKLYGQILTKDYNGKQLNLQQAIVKTIDDLEDSYTAKGLTPEEYPVKEVQDEVRSLVASYRKMAKEQLLGEKITPDDGITPPYYTGITEDGKEAMFPELVQAINRQLNKEQFMK